MRLIFSGNRGSGVVSGPAAAGSMSAQGWGDEFIGIEKLTDKELETLHAKCRRAAATAARLMEQAEAERRSRGSAAAPARRSRRKKAA